MVTMFIPTIAAKDYDAFRRLMNRDLPDSYDKWLHLVLQMTADNDGKGHISEPVDLDPHEFTRFLGATGNTANLHSLRNFAFEKGMGHKY
jgi:hypothetical protein